MNVASWVIIGLSVALIPASALAAGRKNANTSARIIFNKDAGAPTEWDSTRAEYVARHFTPFKGSQVDTVFWCFDEGTTAGYNSKVRDHQRYWTTDTLATGLQRAIAEGNDPPKVAIEEARKMGLKIFYSFRINGHEDSYLPQEIPQFKKDHPNYTLKGMVTDTVWASLNFAIADVRKQRLAVIQEVVDNYDFDGVEIDWLRSPSYFRPLHEYRQRYLLTDMMRAYRKMLDVKGKKIGRKLGLAVRVDESIEQCLMDGLDIEQWVKQGLVDIISMGSGTTWVDVPAFKLITKGKNIGLYPCIYPRPITDNVYPSYTPEIIRGIAANYLSAGSNGVYVMNWGSADPNLKDVGTLKSLAGKDKMFIANGGWKENPDPYYPNNHVFGVVPVELRGGTRTETALSIPVDVADDVIAAAKKRTLKDLRMRVVFDGPVKPTDLDVCLNDWDLSDGQVDGSELIFRPRPDAFRKGRNDIQLYPKGDPGGAKWLTVRTVDVLVRYKAASEKGDYVPTSGSWELTGVHLPNIVYVRTLEPRRPRRIIFNADRGLPTEWDNGKEDYIRRNITPYKGTQVDTVMYCFDEGTTAGYESKVREQQNYWDTGKPAEGLRKAIAEGNDPPNVVCEEMHKQGTEVYYSIRINGHEDSYLPPEVPQFKKDHPDYTLKGVVPDSVWSCLNFAIPDVRAQRLAVLREVLNKYDFDGLEIDWKRSPFYFPPGHEYRHRYLLTDFMRAVRFMVDNKSKRIGRQLGVAVRVEETPTACLIAGLDVEAWVKEGLVDIISMGSGTTWCDIEGFKRITKGTSVKFYPVVYAYPQTGLAQGFYGMPYPPDVTRGIAANYFAGGADGVYTFNWGLDRPELKEIGSVKTMAGKSKVFTAQHTWPITNFEYYPYDLREGMLPVDMWQVAADTAVSIPLTIGDDLAAAAKSGKFKSAKLRVMTDKPVAESDLMLALNGAKLKPLSVSKSEKLLALYSAADSPTESGTTFLYEPDPAKIRRGINQVELWLNGSAGSKAPVRICILDLSVEYK